MNRWHEYWQQDDLQTDVFTDSEGNKHQAIEQFWLRSLSSYPKGAKLLDVASGAGAIYRCVANIDNFDAHALDISSDALALLNEDMPSIKTHAETLESLCQQQHTFDGIVSQFGIEYLGDDAFVKVASLLNESGTCVFLSHIEGGVIASENQKSLDGLLLIQDSNFLSLAEDVAKAFRADNPNAVKKCVSKFMSIEPKVAEYCAKIPKGHHAYLYQGIKEMLSNFNNYRFEDLLEWISVAQEQASGNLVRLKSIANAALNENDIKRIAAICARSGLDIISFKPFHLRPEDLPIAWEIKGVKQR